MALAETSTPWGYWTANRHRRILLILLDGLAWAGCITAANLLRYGFDTKKSLTMNLTLIVVAAVLLQIFLGIVTPLYRARWRIGSLEELVCLGPTVMIVGLAATGFSFIPDQHVVPASATIGGAALALLAASGWRVIWRLNWERHRRPGGRAERTIIFGAGEAGAQLVDALLTDPESRYLPVAVLDDNPAKRWLRLRRLQVVGTRDDLARTAVRHRADSVIIAIPSAGSQLIRDLTDLAARAGLGVKVLPTVSEMLASGVKTDDVRPVSPEDLLGRRVVNTAVDSIAGYLTGRRVLVTGAGGSIGSELCRQISKQQPASLILLDRDESALHRVQLSIHGRALLDDRSIVLCDIRDATALAEVFEEHRPDVVFHAAALKHLPILEMYPAEAVKTNIRGTQNVLDVCGAFGVDRFVNISTDKAVNPTCVLGYSKRIGERLTAAAATRSFGTYLSVRFGNVLDSQGSVLTTFRAQIEAGHPITVTHPDVARYFMTVEEAVELVMQAGAVGQDGEVLVLDMGEPVRIAEVAVRMLEAARRPIDIVYTGLRPGEKLTEELFGDGEFGECRSHPMISHVAAPPIGFDAIEAIERVESPTGLRHAVEMLCADELNGEAVSAGEGAVVDLTDSVQVGGDVDQVLGT